MGRYSISTHCLQLQLLLLLLIFTTVLESCIEAYRHSLIGKHRQCVIRTSVIIPEIITEHMLVDQTNWRRLCLLHCWDYHGLISRIFDLAYYEFLVNITLNGQLCTVSPYIDTLSMGNATMCLSLIVVIIAWFIKWFVAITVPNYCLDQLLFIIIIAHHTPSNWNTKLQHQ